MGGTILRGLPPSPREGEPLHSKVLSQHVFRSTVVLFSAAVLGLPTVASAASPAKGAHFSGKTNEKPARSLSFVVSNSGTAAANFQFSTLGCLASPTAVAKTVKVGTIKLSKSGSFSVSGAKSVITKHPKSTLTVKIAFTVKVSGKFTSKKAATGTISYTESISSPGEPGPKCTSKPLKFTTTS
jgi:hypothetical protein